MSDEKKAIAMLKAVFEDEEAEINGRVYQFTKTNHKKRRKVFAFYTKIGSRLQSGDMSFLDSPEFEPVEKVINDIVMVDGELLSRKTDHWDEYPEDYITFIGTALGVISYPFMRASITA